MTTETSTEPKTRAPRKELDPIIIEKWVDPAIETVPEYWEKLGDSDSLECDNTATAMRKVLAEKLENAEWSSGTYRILRVVREFVVEATEETQTVRTVTIA